jgi:ATP phosphoribosyltransferase
MKIKIAIQKNGRLTQPSLDILSSLTGDTVEPILVRNSDIPVYVNAGIAEFGIVGENVLLEQGCQLPAIKKLGFGKCSLVIAAPEKVKDLSEERIATSYPNTLKKYLRKNNLNASIIKINGSVEICPKLGLCDAICDITQSGKTLKENDLEIVEKIFESEAVLISSPCISKEKAMEFKKSLTI